VTTAAQTGAVYALPVADRYLTIGPFSRRAGISVDLLRAWERRYGVPRPTRTANGRRLYTDADLLLVTAMRRALGRGMPAAEAARVAASTPVESAAATDAGGELSVLRTHLRDTLTAFDDARAQEQLDRLFGAYTVDTALSEVILPYVRELGERWMGNEIGVGHEHFASNLIQGRLLSHARKWDEGNGPLAVLACPSGELHTIGLLCFGLALRARGWRITYLGADTPTATLVELAGSLRPARVVLASVRSETYLDARGMLSDLARIVPVSLAGAGATPSPVADLGAEVLAHDPVTEAARLA
jgi:MerR family transcriptional regulator, light-induced transcriptional regulator